MGALEIGFLIIGAACFIVSFFLSEKLSSSDINEFEKMSKEDMNAIVEKQLRQADDGIRVMIDEGMKDALDDFENKADRMLNQKIMGISDYSDSVLDSIEKSHKEIVFMYNMLIEKQETLTKLTAEIQTLESNLREIKSNIMDSGQLAAYESAMEVIPEIASELPRDDTPIETALEQKIEGEKADSSDSINDRIIQLHKEGATEVEIAKRLGKGLGEIKLVLGLFNRE